MKKYLPVLILLLLFSSPILFAQPRPVLTIKVANNIDPVYRKMVADAVKLINEIIHDPEFERGFVGHHFDWERLGGNVRNGLTAQGAFDTLYRWTDTARINLVIKPRGLRPGVYLSGTMGSTGPGQNLTTTYRNWLLLDPPCYNCTMITYASHIAHEFCHQRNFFDKDVRNQSDFRDVVPYAVGDLMCAFIQRKYPADNCNCQTKPVRCN
ncbi:hypothetical protein BDD43_5406 [Mucilaginibacter gracilis]|uniref:Uncharacterized protein n=1 Tax=Mucilaginibacter gracilis TaxID=423350 RepID=A0A495J830_9SPHI|nr:hypothetical protein [Mucilaginibacter gracilis]RKR85146.1 hypothetical protein BDD43_5406 [Mucilaginibacter gracilis]